MHSLSNKFVLAGLIFFLYACARSPHQLYWKAGETYSQTQSDVTNCEVEALQAVPRAMAIKATPAYTTPVYSTPVKTNCHPQGTDTTCTTTGGQVYGGDTYGGRTYSYDANEPLRERVVMQCLSRRGYRRVTLPVCSEEQAKGAIPLRGARLPFIDKVLCVTKDRSRYVAK